MAKIIGVKEWSDFTLLEDGDVLHGGEDGLINAQAKALTDRTNWLRENMSIGGSGEGGTSGGGLPIGSIIAFGGKTVPFGFLECDGRVLSRGAYIQLYEAIGTLWGSTSESDFKLPNLTEAERFLRSRSGSLTVGTLQGDTIRDIKGTFNPWAFKTGLGSTGVFKDGLIGCQCFNASGQANGQLVDFDISRVHPTADEVRPKSAVVMYCIKVLDSVRDPEQVLAQAVIGDMAHRNEVKELAGTRLWVSGEHQPLANTPTVVNHGLSIDPIRCRCDVQLICKVAEYGYAIGETLISFAIGVENSINYLGSLPPTPFLSANTIQLNTGNGTLSKLKGLSKNDGNFIYPTLANWRYIFRIWY